MNVRRAVIAVVTAGTMLAVGAPVALLAAITGLTPTDASTAVTCQATDQATPTGPDTGPVQIGPVGVINTPTDFADALLVALGDPVTDADVSSIVDWEAREGGNWHNSATFNPLNTTQAEPGSGVTGTQGNIGVYVSWDQGVQATVDTLTNGFYDDIVAALRAGFGLGQGSYAGLLKWSGGGYDHLDDGPVGTVLVATPACTSTALPNAPADLTAAFAYLNAQLGKPYLWGGVGPGAFDCSGLVMMAYAANGITLPRTAAEQYVATASSAVPYSQATPGMLLFWSFDGQGADAHHVAVYLGNGMMIDAPHTGDVVKVEPVWLSSDFLGVATIP